MRTPAPPPRPTSSPPRAKRLFFTTLLLASTGLGACALPDDQAPSPLVEGHQAAATVAPGTVSCWHDCTVLRAYVTQFCRDQGATLNSSSWSCSVDATGVGGGGAACIKPDGTSATGAGGPVRTSDPACATTVPVVPDPPPYTQTVISSGTSWKKVAIKGKATDDTGASYQQNVYLVHGRSGVQNAPLPANLQKDLAEDLGTTNRVVVMSDAVVEGIRTSEQQGKLTDALAAIAEPQETDPAANARLFGKCKDKPIVKSKSFTIKTPYSKTVALASIGTGTATLTGDVSGSATAEITVNRKRYALFSVCIPYAISFESAHASGDVTIKKGAKVSGTLQGSKSWDDEITKPFIGSIDFMAGPVPVHLPLYLPVTTGLEVNVSGSGSVTYDANIPAVGSFDVICTLDGCSGNASYSNGSSDPLTGLKASGAGRVKVEPWVQGALRVALYDEAFAWVQAGVRPYVEGDLWGYSGSGCGDADGDGTLESVSALTFDAHWGVRITGAAAAFDESVKREWNDIWTFERPLHFWDLLQGGSSALKPMLIGPSRSSSGPVSYSARMRPCWPYTDAVDYKIDWGDGQTTDLHGAAASAVATSHSYATAGTKSVTLTAIKDEELRTLGASTSRSLLIGAPTCNGCGPNCGVCPIASCYRSCASMKSGFESYCASLGSTLKSDFVCVVSNSQTGGGGGSCVGGGGSGASVNTADPSCK